MAGEGPLPHVAFDPPGYLNDLSDVGKKLWSMFIETQVRMYVSQRRTDGGTQWFCGLDVDPKTPFVTQAIEWQAFPRRVLIAEGDNPKRFVVADSTRDVQDEYLEWSVTRNAAGKITKVTFTCEGPEYWVAMSKDNPNKLLSLYQQLVDPAVVMSDLFTNGAYNPTNKWNNSTTNGAVHLIQQANTLGAEINLGARATVVRMDGAGNIITDEQQLIKCSKYGNPDRNSDPHIGGQVNSFARAGYLVSITNPIALYISGFFPVGWTTPDGSDPTDYWTIVRGSDSDHALRAVFEVPASKGFTVSDIQTSPGVFINYGSQLADFIRVKLTGIVIDKDPTRVKPRPCPRS